jgi:hypothetical protein
VIRYSIAFVFVLALVRSQAHADLVTYTMTGTIQEVGLISPTNGSPLPPSGGSFPVAMGDRISWTLQYDRSTSPSSSTSGSVVSGPTNNYLPAGPLFTKLVDQTNGYQVPTVAPGSFPANSLSPTQQMNPGSALSLWSYPRGASLSFTDMLPIAQKGLLPYSIQLHLASKSTVPTMNLARLQLDQLSLLFNNMVTPPANQFFYNGQLPGGSQNANARAGYYIDAVVSSLSPAASIQSVPEPGSLTLFALGAVGFAMRRVRRAFGEAG